MLEFTLAERVAMILWKLKRVDHNQAIRTRYHNDQTEANLQTAQAYRDRTLSRGEIPEIDPETVQKYELLRVLPDDIDLSTIIRYEAHLHRQYIQTLHELEALQTRRAGGHAPLARLDISGPPS